MTESILMTVVVSAAIVTGGLGLTACISLFATSGTSNKSNFETWVEARRDVRKAELEVARLEAEHARKCPRLDGGL